MSQMITFKNDLPGLLDDIDEMASLNVETIIALEQVLKSAFELSQAMCPVDTGSLLNSGRTESEVEGDVWSSVLSYGGDSPGYVNDPVDYASYVRAHYGANSWFDQAMDAFDVGFAKAVEENGSH